MQYSHTIELLDLLEEVVSCPLQCPGIRNQPAQGIIPRSFFFAKDPKDVSLLVVGKNPAHAPTAESEIYRIADSGKLVESHLKFVRDLFNGNKSVGTSFHSNLIKRVAGVLGVAPTFESVFAHSALTALVKCESSDAKTDPLTAETMNTCSQRFLLREIEQYDPSYLLALGSEVYRFLESKKQLHGLPVGQLYHPSWSNMKGGELKYFETEIPRLRAAYELSTP